MCKIKILGIILAFCVKMAVYLHGWLDGWMCGWKEKEGKVPSSNIKIF
jgi:hypothetical protein